MSTNGVIGKDGTLPWHFPSDLKHFNDKTVGHTVIMGRRTFEDPDMPKPLPRRRNIVVTRNKDYSHPGVEVVDSVSDALRMCDIEREVFIIGGTGIYELALVVADKLYITIINDEYEGDTYFPDFDWTQYVVVNQDSVEENGTRLTFIEALRTDDMRDL